MERNKYEESQRSEKLRHRKDPERTGNEIILQFKSVGQFRIAHNELLFFKHELI